MGYRSLSCGRPAAEQRYILAGGGPRADRVSCGDAGGGTGAFRCARAAENARGGSRGGGRLAPEALPPAEEISRADAPVNTKGGSE